MREREREGGREDGGMQWGRRRMMHERNKKMRGDDVVDMDFATIMMVMVGTYDVYVANATRREGVSEPVPPIVRRCLWLIQPGDRWMLVFQPHKYRSGLMNQ